MSTCPTISGVRATVTRGEERSALVPRRRREARLGLGEVVRPDRHLLFALPLEGHHLVGGLVAIRVYLVLAEHRLHLELEELLAYLVGVQRARPLHGLGVDDAAGVAGRRVVGRLVIELLLVRVEEL